MVRLFPCIAHIAAYWHGAVGSRMHAVACRTPAAGGHPDTRHSPIRECGNFFACWENGDVTRVEWTRIEPVGFQNSAAVVDLGFLRGPLVLVEEAAEDGPALDPPLGEVSDRVIGCAWVELAAAMRSPAVVVGLVPV